MTAELLEKVYEHEINNLAVRFTELQRSIVKGEAISPGLEGQVFSTYRIASYFLQEHSKKEKVTFLKDEYGWGGTSHTGFDEMHDSKVISYKREYMPDRQYEASVFLKWPEVVKHIDTLIAENRYLSANDIKGIPSYEKDIVARGVYSFYYNQPMDVLRPYEDASDYRQAESSIRTQMATKKDIVRLLEGMEQVLDNTSDTDRHYESMLEKYHDLQACSEGTFTLFNNLDKKYADVNDDDLWDALSNYVLTDGVKAIIDNLISSGEGNTTLQSCIDTVVQMGAETINLETGETADLFVSSTGIDLDIHDKYNTNISASWDEVINTVRLIHYQGWPIHETQNTIDSDNILESEAKAKTIIVSDTSKEMPAENADIEQADKLIQDVAEETVVEEKQERETNKKPDKLEIGTALTIEDRAFVIDSIDEERNKVSLRDVTFQNGTGYPIFRSENVDFVRAVLAEHSADLPPVKENTNKVRANRALISYLHPDIPLSERMNYRITNDTLGHGGAKFRNNIDAIKLLHALDSEERLASPEEQEILAQYVGWGGLPQAFDEKNSSWSSE